MPSPSAVHLVCNAHLDPVWLWEWEEGAAAAVSTFRTAADLCEEFEGFVFCHNEVILYEWVEEYEPQLFARIQRLVAAGKWHVMGGWYLQPDCNMPSGEALVRQASVGRRYFSEKLGAYPTVAINLDPFGHSQGLVQIMARCGYTGYLFCRPGGGDLPLPSELFTWVGYDGSTVAARRVPSYNSPLGHAREKVEGWVDACSEPVTVVLWGVGDHGGGPSRNDLHRLAELISTNPAVRHSTPEAYFAEACAGIDLPRVDRDLNRWAVGCYTSQVRIKQGYRRLENSLFATEKMASAASAAGLMAYPQAELAEAERVMLTSQFHDILPGSSIQPVEEAALRGMSHGMELLSRVRGRSFFALSAGQAPAAEGDIPVLVYNPHPWPVRTVVSCEFQLHDQNWTETFTDVRVVGASGPVPAQVEKEESNLPLDWRKRVVFDAELAPSSMNRFDCKLEVLPARPPRPGADADGDIVLQTSDLSVRIGRRSGLIEEWISPAGPVLAAPGPVPLALEDDEDPWGMRLQRFDGRSEPFRLMTPAEAARFCAVRAAELDPVRVIEHGDARTVVEALFTWGSSSLALRYAVPRNGADIEVEARVFWFEKQKMLKLALPVACGDQASMIGQTVFGRDALSVDGAEAVYQKWIAAVCPATGLALTAINDGSYAADFRDGALRLTLLRSPGYSAHPIGDRDILPQDRHMPHVDQGERVFRYWLSSGPAESRLRDVEREAAIRNEPPMAVSFFPSGQGEAPGPFVTLSEPTVQLASVRRSHDGSGWTLRLVETTGAPTGVTVRLPGLGIEAEVRLGAYEVQTVKTAGDGLAVGSMLE
jgi:alpha-mannosidase